MNLHSYTIVHYGKDYIGYALKSVYDFVDQIHVLFTPHPSHGHWTDEERIETKEDVKQGVSEILRTRPLALTAAGKIRWRNINTVYYEGQQRDNAVETCRYAGADVVLVVDYDEVWPKRTLQNVSEYIASNLGEARNWLFNFTHLWRSFDWCCRDEACPVRFIDLTAPEGTKYIPRELGDAYHFGYAVTDKVMQYKWEIHGHKNDLRPGWFEEKWKGREVGIHKAVVTDDVHPTNGEGFWNAEPFDKTLLPSLMREHPFYNLERIE